MLNLSNHSATSIIEPSDEDDIVVWYIGHNDRYERLSNDFFNMSAHFLRALQSSRKKKHS